jgi:VWFA-related protein
VIENARQHNVVIYTVQVESELARLSPAVSIPYLDPSHGPAILKQLAEETGGCTFMAKRPDDFANALRHIAAALHAHYTLQYQSNQSGDNAEYRRIRVEVSNSKYQVHSRDGYYPGASQKSAITVR